MAFTSLATKYRDNQYPLNRFQQLMVRWDTLAPYNAMHLLKIRGDIDESRWSQAINAELNDLRLGGFQLNRSANRAQFKSREPLHIRYSNLSLNQHIESEMNQAFVSNDWPIRFTFLCQGSEYYLSATYSHWLADSFAIRSLLKRIVLRYEERLEPHHDLTLCAPPFHQLFKQYFQKPTWFTYLTEISRHMQHYAKAWRFRLSEPLDFTTKFHYAVISEPVAARILAYAKAQKVTVNDVFITAIAKVFLAFTAKSRQQVKAKRFKPGRNQIAIGSIVDIRHAAAQSLDHVFGQYLGSTSVIVDDQAQDLLQKVAAQTHQSKKAAMPVKSYALWTWSVWLWRALFNNKRRAKAFHKNAPVVAGISNINLQDKKPWNSFNDPALKTKVIDYLRISPTGPLLPAVFAISTFNNTMSLAVTYRSSVYTITEVETLTRNLLQELSTL